MPKQTFFNLPEEKRERIIEAALEEFSDNDYQSVSISRLVQAAEIAKGSFYQYFQDKADLYHYLLTLMSEKKQELLRVAPPDPEMSIFAYLRWLAQASVAFELKNPRLSRIGYMALRDAGLPQTLLADARTQSHAYFRQLVEQGQAQGDIAAAIDIDLAAFIFSTVFNELGQYMYRRRLEEEGDDWPERPFYESASVNRALNQTLHVLERGMSTSPPSQM